MPTTVQKIRIFLASPNDVIFERDALNRVVDELNHTIAPNKGIALELVRWETHCQPLMGRTQAVINKQIGIYDIFVGIMWKRFGSPTGIADSGTEEEFRLAYDSWTKNKSPLIMFYFCQTAFMPRTHDELEQLDKVLTFRKEVQQKGLVWDYPDSRQFADVIRPHLVRILIDISEEGGESRHNEPTPITGPGSQILLVSGFNKGVSEQVLRYLRELGLNVLTLEERPNQGLTIIEKFDAALEKVQAAVVILSSESPGGSRQNPIFEVGYLIGKLGRRRVIIITEDIGIKMPADLIGAIYLNYQRDRLEPALQVLRKEFINLGMKL